MLILLSGTLSFEKYPTIALEAMNVIVPCGIGDAIEWLALSFFTLCVSKKEQTERIGS